MSEKRRLGVKPWSVALGCLGAPLTMTLFHWRHFDWFWAWPPWAYLLAAPYGLCAISALPFLAARKLTGRWPGWPWLLVSCGLTGGIVLLTADLILGIPFKEALNDGVVYGGLCILAAATFLAFALHIEPGTSWWEERLKTYDYQPDFRVGKPHPTRKGWYATDLVAKQGWPLWYKPPGPINVWIRRVPCIVVAFRGDAGPFAAMVICMIASWPSRYVLMFLTAAFMILTMWDVTPSSAGAL